MINHILGLFTHPGRELQKIKQEGETVSHLYFHHVLFTAAIPVICTYIGTTQIGWGFGNGQVIKILPSTGLYAAIVFYILILGAVALMGQVIHWMAQRYAAHPSGRDCIIFAGYTATPMLLSGIVALYPMVWLCLFAGITGFCYTGYLIYLGIPTFLNIDRKEGFIFSSSTLAIGVLVLELLLVLTVLLWGYGSRIF